MVLARGRRGLIQIKGDGGAVSTREQQKSIPSLASRESVGLVLGESRVEIELASPWRLAASRAGLIPDLHLHLHLRRTRSLQNELIRTTRGAYPFSREGDGLIRVSLNAPARVVLCSISTGSSLFGDSAIRRFYDSTILRLI